jgi:hypothetical protein
MSDWVINGPRQPRGPMDEVSLYLHLDLPSVRRQGRPKIVPPRLRIPYWKGPGTDSEEKHEPASDIDTVAVVESLKALDPKRPIGEADMRRLHRHVGFVPSRDIRTSELAHRATGLVSFSNRSNEFHGFCMNRITLSARASWRRLLVPCSLNSFRCKAAQRL